MSNEFSADERASGKRMRFDSEIEPRYFDGLRKETEKNGKGTILKETIGDYIGDTFLPGYWPHDFVGGRGVQQT